MRDYRAGPFVVKDPDRSDIGWELNDAWDDIVELSATYGYNVNFDEVRTQFSIQECSHAFYVTYMPTIAIADDGIASLELDLANLPYDYMESPGSPLLPHTIAGGGLFLPDIDPICGKIRKFDMYVQGHYDWYGPLGEGDPTVDPDELAAISEMDTFIRKAGFCVFECVSASLEQTAHWLTEDPSTVHEGVPVDDFFTIELNWEKHPFLQTMDPIPIQGGAFKVWEDLTNVFKPNVQNILVDAPTDDIGYVFGAVGSGKTYYMGGHKRKELSDRRLVLNAYVYDVVFPKFSRKFEPTRFASGIDQYLTVMVHVIGGATSLENHILETLAPDVEYVDGSLFIPVPSSTFDGYDPVTRELRMTIGDFNPIDYPDGIVAEYQVKINTILEGPFKVLDHSNSYTDPWNADYLFETPGCSDVTASSVLFVEKTANPDTIPLGVPSTVTLTIKVSNSNTDGGLTNVTVTDSLPGGVTYVPGSMSVTKGAAPDAMPLNWTVGDLAPSEEAFCTFDVQVTASVAGPVTLNTGAVANGLSVGTPVTDTSDVVTVEAVDTTPILQMTVTPLSVDVESTNTFQLCIENIGDDADFVQDVDYIDVLLPEGWSLVPGSVVLPVIPAANWTYNYSVLTRRLVFEYPTGDVNWDNGDEFCFGFDLTSSDEAGVDIMHITTTMNGLTDIFSKDIYLNVIRTCGVSMVSDDFGDTTVDSTICYPHTITNDGNGTDIFNLTYTNTYGWTVNFYEDADSSGTYTIGDVLLTDTDSDSNPDTGQLKGGDSIDIVVCVIVPDTASVGNVDSLIITATSSCDTAKTGVVTDTTTIVPEPTATPTPMPPTNTPSATPYLSPTPTATDTSTPAPLPYSNDFESGFKGWVSDGLWHIVNDSTHSCFRTPVPASMSHSPVTSWYYGKDATCNYNTGIANTGDLISPPIDLTEGATMSFWSWEQTDGLLTTDFRKVYITTNYGVDWILLYESTDNSADWYQVPLDLAPYVGSVVQFKFEFDSVDALLNGYRGWYMDDISVDPYTPTPTPYISPTPTATPDCDDVYTLPFYTDFEGDTKCWSTSGLWHLVSDTTHPCFLSPAPPAGSYSPENSWYYGLDPQCDYDTGFQTTGELVSPKIMLSSDGVIRFMSWEETENFSGFDVREVLITDNDGIDWYSIAVSENNAAEWYEWIVPVDDYTGSVVRIKFRFDSIDEVTNQFPGWYLDDFGIEAFTPTPTPTVPTTPTATSTPASDTPTPTKTTAADTPTPTATIGKDTPTPTATIGKDTPTPTATIGKDTPTPTATLDFTPTPDKTTPPVIPIVQPFSAGFLFIVTILSLFVGWKSLFAMRRIEKN